MPPAAQSHSNIQNGVAGDSGGTHNDSTLPNATNWTTQFKPLFVSGIKDSDKQSEVSKVYFGREFGNGSANGNATYADYSTLSTTDQVAYTMDDGLTSMHGKDVSASGSFAGSLGPNEWNTLTFIGTGVAWRGAVSYTHLTLPPKA